METRASMAAMPKDMEPISNLTQILQDLKDLRRVKTTANTNAETGEVEKIVELENKVADTRIKELEMQCQVRTVLIHVLLFNIFVCLSTFPPYFMTLSLYPGTTLKHPFTFELPLIMSKVFE